MPSKKSISEVHDIHESQERLNSNFKHKTTLVEYQPSEILEHIKIDNDINLNLNEVEVNFPKKSASNTDIVRNTQSFKARNDSDSKKKSILRSSLTYKKYYKDDVEVRKSKFNMKSSFSDYENSDKEKNISIKKDKEKDQKDYESESREVNLSNLIFQMNPNTFPNKTSSITHSNKKDSDDINNKSKILSMPIETRLKKPSDISDESMGIKFKSTFRPKEKVFSENEASKNYPVYLIRG